MRFRKLWRPTMTVRWLLGKASSQLTVRSAASPVIAGSSFMRLWPHAGSHIILQLLVLSCLQGAAATAPASYWRRRLPRAIGGVLHKDYRMVWHPPLSSLCYP